MKTGYSVADAMTTKPVTVSPLMSVRDVSVIMRDREVGSILVVEGPLLVGIVTSEDIVGRVTATDLPADTLVGQIMSTDIIDTRPNADIYDAMVIMREHDILHLPVRDEHKLLLGYLTFKDVLKIEPQLFELMQEMAETKKHDQAKPELKEGYCEECGNYSTDLTRHAQKLLCGYCSEY